MRWLALIAFICGIASAAWWNFGPDILQNHLHIAKETTSMLWLVSGGAGIAGIFTGALAARTGWNPVYWLSLLFMAAPLVLLAVSHGYSGWLIPAAPSVAWAILRFPAYCWSAARPLRRMRGRRGRYRLLCWR
jgi:predicted MFS family arabinose efflux permease